MEVGVERMTDREKLAFLLATSPHLDVVDGRSYDRAADDLIANGVTVQKWISVEDRLPDKTMKCLVYQTGYGALGGFVAIATYTPCYNGMEGDPMNGRRVWYKYCGEWGEYEALNVTHWMPLPEEPKEEADCHVGFASCAARPFGVSQ